MLDKPGMMVCGLWCVWQYCPKERMLLRFSLFYFLSQIGFCCLFGGLHNYLIWVTRKICSIDPCFFLEVCSTFSDVYYDWRVHGIVVGYLHQWERGYHITFSSFFFWFSYQNFFWRLVKLNLCEFGTEYFFFLDLKCDHQRHMKGKIGAI